MPAMFPGCVPVCTPIWSHLGTGAIATVVRMRGWRAFVHSRRRAVRRDGKKGMETAMRAMVLSSPGTRCIERKSNGRCGARPGPATVHVCGVCRTDLHVIDGELPDPKLPLVLGHQIVATVEGLGAGVEGLPAGERVGVPWLGFTCVRALLPLRSRKSLPGGAFHRLYDRRGYAEYCVADARYCFRIPAGYPDEQAARCSAPA